MITKNEEIMIAQSLESVKNLVDEMIIVDTGSTDKTKEIAAKFTDKIFDFSWNDDFSAARNESLKQATGDWIIVLDADEVLDKETQKLILTSIQDPDYMAYYLPQVHYTNIFLTHPDFVKINHPHFKGYYISDIIRLFRRSPDINFEFCVHETVQFSLQRAGGKIGHLAVPIHHYHELKGNLPQKQEYYFQLSLKTIEKYPHYARSYNDAAVHYNQIKGDLDKALYYCRKAVEREPLNLQFNLHLSYILRDQGKYGEALDVLNKIQQKFSDERIFRAKGFIYYQMKKYDSALEAYHQAIGLGSPLKERLENYCQIIQKEKKKESPDAEGTENQS